MQRTHFIPRVAVEQIDAADQALLLLTEAKDVELTEIEMHHLIAESGGRIVLKVDDNRQMADFAWAVERFRRRRRQTQWKMRRHVVHQLLQACQIADLVAFDMQTRLAGQQAVEPRPGHQLIQVAVILQRLMADD